jgi:hypothetical protein
MYCSSCGSTVQQNLSYCNHCGAKVSAAPGAITKPTELSPTALLNAIGVVFVLGLAAFTALMALAKEGVGFNPVILAAAMLSFVLLVGMETVLIWLLLRGRRGSGETVITRSVKKHTTNELPERHPRELPEPLPSVTEHTTRAFDPAFTDRESK